MVLEGSVVHVLIGDSAKCPSRRQIEESWISSKLNGHSPLAAQLSEMKSQMPVPV